MSFFKSESGKVFIIVVVILVGCLGFVGYKVYLNNLPAEPLGAANNVSVPIVNDSAALTAPAQTRVEHHITGPFDISVCENSLPAVKSKSGLVDWVEPQYLKDQSFFSLGDRPGDNVYLVGHITGGKYKGGDLYLVDIAVPAMGPSDNYDHVISFNGKYYWLTKYSESYNQKGEAVPSPSLIADKNFSLPDLDFPESFTINSPTSTLSHIANFEFVQLDHTKFCLSGLVKIFTSPEVGDVYVNSTSSPQAFYVKVPDGSQRVYTLNFDIMGDQNVPLVTWSDGENNSDVYNSNNMTFCGQKVFVDVANVSTEDLVQTGSAFNGKPVYEYKNPEAQGLKDVYAGMNGKLNGGQAAPSFEVFQSEHPVFFWKDQFGRFIRFINDKYQESAYCG